MQGAFYFLRQFTAGVNPEGILFFCTAHQKIFISSSGIIIGHFRLPEHIDNRHVGRKNTSFGTVGGRIIEFPVQRAGTDSFQASEIFDPIFQCHGIIDLAVINRRIKVIFFHEFSGKRKKFRQFVFPGQRQPSKIITVEGIFFRETDKTEFTHESGAVAENPFIIIPAVIPSGTDAGIRRHNIEMGVALIGRLRAIAAL